MSLNTRKRPLLSKAIFGGVALVLLAGIGAGCGQKEEPVPQGSTYYTGPMTSKGANNPVIQQNKAGGAAAPSAAGNP